MSLRRLRELGGDLAHFGARSSCLTEIRRIIRPSRD
jgi:hypothetical protein